MGVGRIEKGVQVRFVRAFNGKKQGKVAKGATGKVVWTGADRFHDGGMRAGVKVDGLTDTVFVDMAILETTARDFTDDESRDVAERIIAAKTDDERRAIYKTALEALAVANAAVPRVSGAVVVSEPASKLESVVF